ncbi:MAG: DUF2269 domain-containing protein [Nocardioidaceae bacterium]
MMSPGTRKLLLTVHVTSSVGWLGAIAAYIALNVSALAGDDEQTIRAAYLMMDVVMRYALIPLATASLATGIAQALGTPWGLFRHYWVTISLALTTFAYAILVLHLPTVEGMASVAADPHGDLTELGGDLFHSVGGLVVLLVPLTLNIYKPRGMTRYGWRRTRDLTTRGT